MLIRDLYPLGPGSQPISAEAVASTLSRHADPYGMDSLDVDLGAVVRAAAEWKGDMQPQQGWFSKLRGDAIAPAGREEFLNAVEVVVGGRGLVDERGFWCGP